MNGNIKMGVWFDADGDDAAMIHWPFCQCTKCNPDKLTRLERQPCAVDGCDVPTWPVTNRHSERYGDPLPCPACDPTHPLNFGG